MKTKQTNNHINTRRGALRTLFAAVLAIAATFTQTAKAAISSETPVGLNQYEVFTGGMRMALGGTVGRRITVRLYEVSPAGVPALVKAYTVRIKTDYPWRSGASKLRFPAGLFKAGSGLRYAFTVQPEGNKRTDVLVLGPTFIGDGQTWRAFPNPLYKPYTIGGRRLPVTQPGVLPEIVEE